MPLHMGSSKKERVNIIITINGGIIITLSLWEIRCCILWQISQFSHPNTPDTLIDDGTFSSMGISFKFI